MSGRALPPDMALSAIFGVPNTFAVRHVTHYHAEYIVISHASLSADITELHGLSPLHALMGSDK